MLDVLRALIHRRLDPVSRLLLGQLVMFTGIAALFPVVPLYVRSHGGGPTAVALFIAGPMVANTLVQIPAGHVVDRFGRKPVLIGSRLAYSALAFALFANVGPLWLLAILRCLQGASGGAYVPALRAALADLTPPDSRGQSYAKLQAVEMVGLLIGPAIGGVVALWTYSAIFLCAGLATLLGVTALFRLPEPKNARFESPAPGSTNAPSSSPRGWWRSRAILVPSFGLLCGGTLFSMYDVVWPQYLNSRHVGTVLIGFSISLFAVPVLLLATSAGRLSDRSNRRVIAAGAFLIVACTASLYPEIYAYPIIIGIGLIEAVGFMLVEPTLFAVMSDSTAADIRGRAMGVGGFFQFAGGAAGAGGLGALYGVSPGLPFWGGAAACILAAIICGLWLPVSRRSSIEPEPLPQLPAVDLEAQS